MIKRTLYHFHFCCGLGGGAAGFNRARPRVGNVEAEWVCLGGIDVDPAGLRDFERLAGVPGTLLDLFTRDQYVRFHGKEPPAGWREATPEDVRRAAQGKRPDAVFISSPCKGASGLLSEKMSLTPKYQALNELTLRCIWLMGEAWADDPVPLIVFENVPRLASRGRHLLDQINSLLGGFGYAVAETTHDCGELGGLAQSRKRFLLVARHVEKVPPFLYEPEKKSLRAVGDILGRMPLPGDIDAAGPMHRVPSLQWKTWVRLALVRAGSDWRSLNDLAVEDGYLRDLIIVPEYHRGVLGVNHWGDSCGVVAGASRPMNGRFSVADPRAPANALQYQQYGVRRCTDTSGAIIGVKPPAQAQHSVPEISGIGRDAEHPRAVVLYLRNEPSEEDMRAIQNFLRAISADVLTQAQHSAGYAEARMCANCQHIGINDAADYAACHDCNWTGPEPDEDKCPGCAGENCMAAACPECGGRYDLVAEANITAPAGQVPQAWLDVQAERRRQITAEGWTPEHDDLYCAAELPRAAAAYILNGANDEAPAIWPFSAKWWKPRDARSNYVRASALILAEIERLDRAAAAGKEVGHE